jgi:hypothetical protein
MRQPHRIAELALQQIANDRLVVRGLFVHLPPNPAKPAAKVVEHDEDVLIVFGWACANSTRLIWRR